MAWSRSDDLDGTPAEQSLFGFDGQMYAIDLGPASLERMRKALQPFLTLAQNYGDMPKPEDMDPSILDTSPPQVWVFQDPSPTSTPKGTKVAKGAQKVKKAAAKNGKLDFADIRAWANQNGYTVGATGRIPAAVLDAYASGTSAL